MPISSKPCRIGELRGQQSPAAFHPKYANHLLIQKGATREPESCAVNQRDRCGQPIRGRVVLPADTREIRKEWLADRELVFVLAHLGRNFFQCPPESSCERRKTLKHR